MLFKKLVGFATVLTLCLIMLGAYVRLSDAGLGCPDWPGCYGKLSPLHASEHIKAAVAEQGGTHGPVSVAKAWKEMLHRYVASFLGLLIVAIAVLAWRQRERLQQSPWLTTALVGVVCLQGAFGAWTVTLLLRPAIVTGHLIGGMLVLALLTWLWLRQTAPARTVAPPAESRHVKQVARLGLLVVALQIVLGGWVSTNYAAVVCTSFPGCQGSLWPDMEFNHAFHAVRELGETPEGDMLNVASLTAIHMVHRAGALVVAIVLAVLAIMLWRRPGMQVLALTLVAALTLQIGMGIGNVLLHLPLWLAVLHNGGAALLLMVLILINYRLASRVHHYTPSKRFVQP
ncbi:MAG: heme A synthase [Limnobacter sp.]|nr:heme A synthase [Limnobacter sp.]